MESIGRVAELEEEEAEAEVANPTFASFISAFKAARLVVL